METDGGGWMDGYRCTVRFIHFKHFYVVHKLKLRYGIFLELHKYNLIENNFILIIQKKNEHNRNREMQNV